MWHKLKNFIGHYERYEAKIVLIFGLILVAIVSFEAGVLQGQKWNKSPLVIEKSAQAQNLSPEAISTATTAAQISAQAVKSTNSNTSNCAFVGSKNSNKYHIPTCRWAKQIKPENIVCFSSAEDAVSKGYQPGCLK